MLVNKRAESPGNICGQVDAVGRIVPGYFPPASPLAVFPGRLSVQNPFTVPALFQRHHHTGMWLTGPLPRCQGHRRCRSDVG